MRLLALILLFLLPGALSAQSVTVGSKKFTESYVLGEIAKKALEDAGFKVEHKQGIGATGIVWAALAKGDIGLYPEYTGTISEEILKKPGLDIESMKAELKALGIGMSKDLGFNDGYGLAMTRATAQKLGVAKISDLTKHPELEAGITHEYLGRKDGWAQLTQKYGLRFAEVRSIDHGLAYAALQAGKIALTDCYTTDAEIKKYDLIVLEDDRGFFPLYRAHFLYRLDLPTKAVAAIDALGGTIDEKKMIALNAEANRTKDYAAAAAMYFKDRGQNVVVKHASLAEEILPRLWEHLWLVGVSLLAAVVVGVPLGIVASRPGPLGGFILSFVGLVQTIPSLALFGLLVPFGFFGIGLRTAIFALFLYSLLPIVRNTATGLGGIPPNLRESAEALGLDPGARLRQVYLPMALPTILAGIKTSAVINVGTATIAALIGAGGLGQLIQSGLNLNDNATILKGAVPAALLALVVQGAFDLLERGVVSKGLR
ncbi:ABC transporter permease subunit [bacterium]|nr:MAG: ABC transporter permease subunit [bacterium]